MKDKQSINGNEEDNRLNFSLNEIRWLSGFKETKVQKSRFTIYQNLWSTDTDTNTKHDMDTDMPTPLIIWENYIIQSNYKCRCRVVSVSDTTRVGHRDTPNPRSVPASCIKTLWYAIPIETNLTSSTLIKTLLYAGTLS